MSCFTYVLKACLSRRRSEDRDVFHPRFENLAAGDMMTASFGSGIVSVGHSTVNARDQAVCDLSLSRCPDHNHLKKLDRAMAQGVKYNKHGQYE